MSKLIKMLVLVPLFAITSMAYAGANITGTVSVNSAKTTMWGAFDVRYNYAADVNQEYIGAAFNAFTKSVTFYGRDQTNGYFSCTVDTGSGFYARSKQVALNLTHGAYIYVSKETDSNSCSYVSLNNDSRRL